MLKQCLLLVERHVLVIGRRALVAREDELVEAVAAILLASGTDASTTVVLRLFQLLDAVPVLAPFALVVVDAPVDVVVVVAYHAAVGRHVLGVIGNTPRGYARAVSPHAHAFFQVGREAARRHAPVAVWTITFLGLFDRVLAKHIQTGRV